MGRLYTNQTFGFWQKWQLINLKVSYYAFFFHGNIHFQFLGVVRCSHAISRRLIPMDVHQSCAFSNHVENLSHLVFEQLSSPTPLVLCDIFTVPIYEALTLQNQCQNGVGYRDMLRGVSLYLNNLFSKDMLGTYQLVFSPLFFGAFLMDIGC